MSQASATAAPLAAAASPGPRGKAAYLDYLGDFRAVAIMFVVMIHANNAMLQRGVEGALGGFSWVWTLFHILSHNATIYFALISGVLYAYSLHRKPHGQFMRSRLETVVLPYAIVSTVLTLLGAGMAAMRGADGLDAGVVLGRIGTNILTGEAWNHLWYISVITVLYIVSPLLLRLIAHPRYGRVATVILVLLPLVASRTGTEVTASMLVYFTGVYTVGLVIGRDPEAILAWLKPRTAAIAAAALIAAAVIWKLDMYGIDAFGPTSLRESAFYVLRIALAILMLGWLRDHSATLGPRMRQAFDQIAACSFGIYFLHAPLLRPIVKVLGPLVPAGNPSWALVLAVLVTFVISLVSTWLIVVAIMKLTGAQSKRIIGS